MKAFRFNQWHRSERSEDVPGPEPGAGEARIRIGGPRADPPPKLSELSDQAAITTKEFEPEKHKFLN